MVIRKAKNIILLNSYLVLRLIGLLIIPLFCIQISESISNILQDEMEEKHFFESAKHFQIERLIAEFKAKAFYDQFETNFSEILSIPSFKSFYIINSETKIIQLDSTTLKKINKFSVEKSISNYCHYHKLNSSDCVEKIQIQLLKKIRNDGVELPLLCTTQYFLVKNERPRGPFSKCMVTVSNLNSVLHKGLKLPVEEVALLYSSVSDESTYICGYINTKPSIFRTTFPLLNGNTNSDRRDLSANIKYKQLEDRTDFMLQFESESEILIVIRESMSTGSVFRSRAERSVVSVVRICKNDPGGMEQDRTESSFGFMAKANLICQKESDDSGGTRRTERLSHAIHASWNEHSKLLAIMYGEKTIKGRLFAVCFFHLSDILRVFRGPGIKANDINAFPKICDQLNGKNSNMSGIDLTYAKQLAANNELRKYAVPALNNLQPVVWLEDQSNQLEWISITLAKTVQLAKENFHQALLYILQRNGTSQPDAVHPNNVIDQLISKQIIFKQSEAPFEKLDDTTNLVEETTHNTQNWITIQNADEGIEVDSSVSDDDNEDDYERSLNYFLVKSVCDYDKYEFSAGEKVNKNEINFINEEPHMVVATNFKVIQMPLFHCLSAASNWVNGNESHRVLCEANPYCRYHRKRKLCLLYRSNSQPDDWEPTKDNGKCSESSPDVATPDTLQKGLRDVLSVSSHWTPWLWNLESKTPIRMRFSCQLENASSDADVPILKLTRELNGKICSRSETVASSPDCYLDSDKGEYLSQRQIGWWSDWSGWGKCINQTQRRTRTCPEDKWCSAGNAEEYRSCSDIDKYVHNLTPDDRIDSFSQGEWLEWSDWTMCNLRTARESRVRACSLCRGSTEQYRSCNFLPITHAIDSSGGGSGAGTISNTNTSYFYIIILCSITVGIIIGFILSKLVTCRRVLFMEMI